MSYWYLNFFLVFPSSFPFFSLVGLWNPIGCIDRKPENPPNLVGIMHLSIETLTPTPPHPIPSHPIPSQDKVGISLEGAPNARKPPPLLGTFWGGTLSKITIWSGAHEAKSHEPPTLVGQKNAPNSHKFPTFPHPVLGDGGRGSIW